jgi:hypothetical protein
MVSNTTQLQRKVRQREVAWDWLVLSTGAHLYFYWRGRIWVRHCCCVLARCLGKEAKMLCPCYLAYHCICNSKLTFDNLFILM